MHIVRLYNDATTGMCNILSVHVSVNPIRSSSAYKAIGQTDKQGDSYIPHHFVCGRYNKIKDNNLKAFFF